MRLPHALYRLQFNKNFTFKDTEAIIDYLHVLGISDIYASPIFESTKGSMHGYDVSNPKRINHELGNETGFVELRNAMKEKNMGWIQDIVPNHMIYGYENKLLMDIFEHGMLSPYINYFDIDWFHPYENMHGKVLAPFLGQFYSICLENQELILSLDENGFSVNYYSRRFPLKVNSYLSILKNAQEYINLDTHDNEAMPIEMLELIEITESLNACNDYEKRLISTKHIKERIWNLFNNNSKVHTALEKTILLYNGNKDKVDSFDHLDELLNQQMFRLSFWKVGCEELNYRRFFTVNDLISVKVENSKVYEDLHSKIIEYYENGLFTGLRVDHIDGLYNPTVYLKRLRSSMPDAYITIEKILETGEDIDKTWPIQGSTGYNFLGICNSLFCKYENEKIFSQIYKTFSGQKLTTDEIIREKKLLIIGNHFAGDVDNLSLSLKRILNSDRYGRDITMYSLRRALVEIMSHFPVYRTYLARDKEDKKQKDFIREALNKAKTTKPGLLYEINHIENFLLFNFPNYISEDEKVRWISFVKNFQQVTGPLMAKGVEDTAFYIYNRLLSLNEVGSALDKFGTKKNGFHNFNINRQLTYPTAINTLSTHDTKRGEDTRARINVLSEIPTDWRSNLKLWAALNKGLKQKIDGHSVPDKNDEYFLYQTMIGIFPWNDDDYDSFKARIKEYIVKAVREAKVYTAWLKPDEVYEKAYLDFFDKICEDKQSTFINSFKQFQDKITFFGVLNSISQTVLKYMCPGIPDIYQGTELWDFTLVDPDNRRPVDYQHNKDLLGKIMMDMASDRKALLSSYLSKPEDGKIKLLVVYLMLRLRNSMPMLFMNASYDVLHISGTHADNVIAFKRSFANQSIIVICARFFTELVPNGILPLGHECWEETLLLLDEPKAEWKNIFTDEKIILEHEITIAELLKNFPVAVLVKEC